MNETPAPPAPAENEERSESLVTVLVALAANTVIAVLKTVVAVLTGSASMVAEATHSWADAGNEVFLYVAERRSTKPADAKHPLGYGRAAYVWSMIAAFGLFAVGSAVSVIHGVQALREPAEETDYFWAYAILAAAFVLEGISFLQARRQLRTSAERASMSRLSYLSRTSNPLLRAVFFEDAAALVGLTIAGAGIAAHQLTGNAMWDAIGSILVGVVLGFVAVFLLQRNIVFLVGQVADAHIIDTARSWLLEQPEVESVRYLYLEYIGPERLFVIASVDLAGNDPEAQAALELDALERRMEQHPTVQKALITLGATTLGTPRASA